MIHVIYKNRNYQDFGNKRIDVGLYYVEEECFTSQKDVAIFGNGCSKEFLENDVFFDDKVGAYIECMKRNEKVIDSLSKQLIKE